MASLLTDTVHKFTAGMLRSAAKQSQGCHVVPVRLRRAIKRFVREQEENHMRRKVLSLSQSFNAIKDVNLYLAASASKSSYGDTGLKYSDEHHTAAYVTSPMPPVYSACSLVLNEVREHQRKEEKERQEREAAEAERRRKEEEERERAAREFAEREVVLAREPENGP